MTKVHRVNRQHYDEGEVTRLLHLLLSEQQHTNALLRRLLRQVEACCRAAQQLVALAGASLHQLTSLARALLLQIQAHEQQQLRAYLSMVKHESNAIMLTSLLVSSLRAVYLRPTPTLHASFGSCAPPAQRWRTLHALSHALGLSRPTAQAGGVLVAWRTATCCLYSAGRFLLGWGILAALLASCLRSILSSPRLGHSASAWCSPQLQLPQPSPGPDAKAQHAQRSAVQPICSSVAALAHADGLHASCSQPVPTHVVVLSMLRGTCTLLIGVSLWLMGGSIVAWLSTRLVWSLLLAHWMQQQAGRLLGPQAQPRGLHSWQAVLAEQLALPLLTFLLVPAANGAVPFHGAASDLALGLWRLILRLGLPLAVVAVLVIGAAKQ